MQRTLPPPSRSITGMWATQGSPCASSIRRCGAVKTRHAALDRAMILPPGAARSSNRFPAKFCICTSVISSTRCPLACKRASTADRSPRSPIASLQSTAKSLPTAISTLV
jgi:hypothetical protein